MSEYYTTDDGHSYRCDWCNKIVIPPYGLRGYFTNGDTFREYHFCSNACYFPFKKNTPLVECNENGEVYKQKEEQLVYISPEINDDDFDIEEFEKLHAKRNKPISKPSPKQPHKESVKDLSKKEIKQSRKNAVKDFTEFMKNKKK